MASQGKCLVSEVTMVVALEASTFLIVAVAVLAAMVVVVVAPQMYDLVVQVFQIAFLLPVVVAAVDITVRVLMVVTRTVPQQWMKPIAMRAAMAALRSVVVLVVVSGQAVSTAQATLAS